MFSLPAGWLPIAALLTPALSCTARPRPLTVLQKYVPLDLRVRKTRAIRRRLTKSQVGLLPLPVCTVHGMQSTAAHRPFWRPWLALKAKLCHSSACV